MTQKSPGGLSGHLVDFVDALRGKGISDPDGVMRPIEIIEDVPELHDMAVSIRLDSQPKTVTGFDAGPLDWEYSDGRLTFTVPKLYIHEAVIIERP